MSGLGLRFAALFCLLVFLSKHSLANFWLPATLPSNPSDSYYQTFQTVPTASVTATKLINNFLRIYPANRLSRRSFYIDDIVVVLDGSGSIGSCDFGKRKEALKLMIKSSGSNAKYAAVTFANSAIVNFKFLPYSTAAKEILKISYPGGGTNTPVGLAQAKALFDDTSSGGRPNARKMVFLVTDGQSNNKDLTIAKAQELKRSGLEIFVVGVGTYIYGIDEMVKVASYPPERYLFRVKTLGGLLKVIKLIYKEVSPGEYKILNGQPDPPCRWG